MFIQNEPKFYLLAMRKAGNQAALEVVDAELMRRRIVCIANADMLKAKTEALRVEKENKLLQEIYKRS